ncbi:MAG: IS4/IS5 family transposase, partial [Myxococcota bacterium]
VAGHQLNVWTVWLVQRRVINNERCQARKARKQRNHIGLAIRAFVRLEVHRYRTGRSRFQIKADILREAIRHYLTNPIYVLEPSTA